MLTGAAAVVSAGKKRVRDDSDADEPTSLSAAQKHGTMRRRAATAVPLESYSRLAFYRYLMTATRSGGGLITCGQLLNVQQRDVRYRSDFLCVRVATRRRAAGTAARAGRAEAPRSPALCNFFTALSTLSITKKHNCGGTVVKQTSL